MKHIDHDQAQGQAELFHMVFDDKLDQFLYATKVGELEPRDGTVLLAIIRHTNFRTSRAEVSITDLAKELGQRDASNVTRSIGRLQRQWLVVKGITRTPPRRFLMLNPYLCCGSNKPDRQRELYGQFKALFE